MRRHRRVSRQVSLGLAALLLLSLLGWVAEAAPALAVTEGHVFSFNFGSEGTGNGQFFHEAGFVPEVGQGVAVDQSNGDVYVSDTANHRVEKFDSSGNFIAAWGWGVLNGGNESQVCNAPASCQAGLTGAGPGQFSDPTALAVDNSGGPSNGDVYVADSANRYILKFSPDGTYLGKIDGAESPGGRFEEFPNGVRGGAAVIDIDGKGNLYVTTGQRVMTFDSEVENEYVGGSEWRFNGLFDLTVNKAGTKLLAYGISPFTHNPATFLANTNGTTVGLPLSCQGSSARFDPATDDFLTSNGESVCELNQSGKQVAEPFGEGILDRIGGIAVDETTDDVYVVDAPHVQVFKPRVIPDVLTGPATAVEQTTATLNGQVAPDPAAGGDVGECYFQYLPDSQYETLKEFVPVELIFRVLSVKASCNQPPPITASESVSADLAGLSAETTYAYRVAAANSIDTAHGAVRTFTPHWVLGTATDPATDVGVTAATLNGEFDADGHETHYYFEWGPTTSYGSVTAAPPGVEADSAPGLQSVSVPLTGLLANTVYHYRIVTQNPEGISSGEDVTVKTAPPQPPGVSSTEISEVTDVGAHLSAMVNPNLGPTIYKFQYGANDVTESETLSSQPIGEDEANHMVTADLSELAPGTTYRVRVIATNFGGTSPGPTVSFTTTSAPIIAEEASTEVSAASATLKSLVSPGLSSAKVHFEYGLTEGYGGRTSDIPLGADGEYHLVSAPLTGLAPQTTYHFRAVAANGVGTSTGPDQTFTTSATRQPPPPPPVACHRGFVRKHGRCVRRSHHHRTRHPHLRPAKGRR